MSNAVVVSGAMTKTGNPIAVFGPQTGYFSPQLLMLEDLQGPGISARGAAFAGVNLYVQLGRGQDYLKQVSILPPSYRRISHGDEISIGTRRFKVITGGGHALDQVMLYCAADKLFLSADQVLSKISPNVSVWAVEPDQNSLGEYLASLASLTTTLPYDVMVLPGHGVPFYGLKTRIKQLADHHEDRCQLIAEACRETPQTSAQLVPVVFHKHVLDPHQMGFAAGELIAHVNYMLVEGRLTAEEADGVLRFRTT
jgi:glyoxylase-like metal-dependent hydrolase (beta-lactamase superfamily II)